MAVINNRQLIQAIEELKIEGAKQHMEFLKKNSFSFSGDYISAEGKGTVFYTPKYCCGLGFGLGGKFQEAELDRLEEKLAARNITANLHLEITPFSEEAFIAVLQKKGYTFDHFLSVWVLDASKWENKILAKKQPETEIFKVDDFLSYDWAWTVALGISQNHTATEEAMESVRAFWEVPNNTAFLMKEKKEDVAGAAVAVNGNLAELFLAGTIKPFRKKGYQNQLIAERIRYAKEQGCQFITVTTKPGNSSSRNMERHGFSLLYQRAVLKSPLLRK